MDTALAPAAANTLPAAPGPSAPPGLGARMAALPTRSKLAAVLGTGLLVGLIAMMAIRARDGDYKPLYPGMSEREAGLVVEKLTQMNVPYRTADGSGTLMVPAARLHDLKMKLAVMGIPKGAVGAVDGYELLDKQPFGQTQGQERYSQKRALEGELVRAMMALRAVADAKVLLALPQMNGFYREQTKPTASVTLTLHPGRTLDPAQVAGIVHLVASSVPELSPKDVSVIDASSNLLSQPKDANQQGLDAQQLQFLRDTESTLAKRVLQLVEPVLGRENVRATVTAEIDFSQTEVAAEEFKPNQGEAPAAVKATSVVEQQGTTPTPPGAVAGAQSNQPQAAASAPINGAKQEMRAAQAPTGNGGSSSRREQETRYEVDKKVSFTRGATGTVRRLNAAVVVNNRSVTDAKGKTTVVPLSPEEIEKLTALVQQGIGYNKERGDSVRVVNAAFHVDAPPKVEELPFWKETWVQDMARSAAMPAALLLVGLVTIFGLIRPAIKPLLAPPPPPPEEAAKAGGVSAVIGGDEQLPALAGDTPAGALPAPSADKLEAVRAMARQNPAGVAQVLRGWANPEAAA